MLTQSDLKWVHKFFSLYSKLNLIPVSFKPFNVGGQMEFGRASDKWSRFAFKSCRILFTCQTVFVSFRTFEYASGSRAGFSGGENKSGRGLDWDLVPFMLIFS